MVSGLKLVRFKARIRKGQYRHNPAVPFFLWEVSNGTFNGDMAAIVSTVYFSECVCILIRVDPSNDSSLTLTAVMPPGHCLTEWFACARCTTAFFASGFYVWDTTLLA